MVEYVTEDGLLSIDLALRPPPAAKRRQAAALLAQAPTAGGSGAGRQAVADARCTFQGSDLWLVQLLCRSCLTPEIMRCHLWLTLKAERAEPNAPPRLHELVVHVP